MKKNAFRFILSFAVAILSLLVCLPKNSVWAATVAQDQATCYMIDTGGSTYQTNIDAGSATGYGEYLLGDTDIAPIKAISLHHGTIVILMSSPQLRRHGYFVVEIGKRTVWI